MNAGAKNETRIGMPDQYAEHFGCADPKLVRPVV